MNRGMIFFKQKMVWVAVAAVLVVLMVFGLAMMGSVAGAKPKNLPVALVVLDREVSLPGGGKMAVGQMIQEKLMSNTQLPVRFEVLDSEAEAVQGMDQQKYYGALVLSEDMSAGLASLQTPAPKQGSVRIYANEGMSFQTSSLVKQMLQQIMQGVSSELSRQLLAQIGQKSPQIPVSIAEGLLTPFSVKEQTVHSAGANNANGNAPNLLTQILWMATLATSIFLYLASKKAMEKGGRRGSVTLAQMGTGLVVVALAAGFLLWMASSWYGMEIADTTETFLFLVLAGAAFYLLQTALLNWLGFPAMGLLVLLLFFSMPVIGMAPEFLPQATRDWLYPWIPFRFVTSGLRTILYFAGIESSVPIYRVLWSLAGGSFLLMAASVFKRRLSDAPSSEQTEAAA